MFAINLGDQTLNDAGLDGYFDNVVTDLTSGVTIYDFDVSKEDCMQGGWMTLRTPSFSNQGDCVSFIASEGKSGKEDN